MITEVLTACGRDEDGRPLSPSAAWSLTVGTRLAALLRVAAESGNALAAVTMSCPACGEVLESEFDLGAVAELEAAPPADLVHVSHGGATLMFRRPTGEDQRGWVAAAAAEPESAARAMAARLRVAADDVRSEVPLDDEWIARLDQALAAADPLVSFVLSAGCPSCGAACSRPVDLAALALAQLRAVQGQLYDSVHRLALAYHWTEREIFDLPAGRRTRYLSLVGAA